MLLLPQDLHGEQVGRIQEQRQQADGAYKQQQADSRARVRALEGELQQAQGRHQEQRQQADGAYKQQQADSRARVRALEGELQQAQGRHQEQLGSLQAQLEDAVAQEGAREAEYERWLLAEREVAAQQLQQTEVPG
jgi:hypothetical protein